jgi:hypothetical protein
VISHQQTLVLEAVAFKVSEKGRQRVLKEKQKNVHAYVCGSWVQQKDFDPQLLVQIKYDPYKQNSFFRVQDNSPIEKADFVVFEEHGKCYAINPS